MDYLGYIGVLIIGISLGIVGGGGSILSLPVLVYLFHFPTQYATAYSLFIVGFTSLVGGIQKSIKGLVCWRTVLWFGIPSVLSVIVVRKYIMPMIPQIVYQSKWVLLTQQQLILGLFALVMFWAAWSMLRPEKSAVSGSIGKHWIWIEGLLVGGFTGLLGAGGGFIIIPALVGIVGLDMKKAIATSLIIIAVKSLSGFFLGDVWVLTINWIFLIELSVISIVGMFMGEYLSRFINEKQLKSYFGVLIILIGFFMMIKEFLF